MKGTGRVPKSVWMALIAATVSFFLAKSFILAPFFLVPLALVSLSLGTRAAWLGAVFSLLINGVFSVLYRGEATGFAVFGDLSYLAAVLACFTWAVAGPDRFFGGPRIRLAYRFLIAGLGASLGTLALALFAGSSLQDLFLDQATRLVEMLRQAQGADVVERSLMESSLTPEALLESSKAIALRSGAFLHAIFFAISWRFALMLAGIKKPRLRATYTFSTFKVDANFVWVLLPSLALILLGFVVSSEVLDTIAWNGALCSALLYAAQGLGVIDFNLARPQVPRGLRFPAVLLLFLVALRPGLNGILAAVIAILGLAENWLPLRAPISSEPPSTPEA